LPIGSRIFEVADTLLFDKLAYMDRLKADGIDENQTRPFSDALDEALRESVATKSGIAALRIDIERLEHRLTMLQAQCSWPSMVWC
jgi:polyhydroxyalkanoate synthesis regulator phasin